jgi:hypothetical protein
MPLPVLLHLVMVLRLEEELAELALPLKKWTSFLDHDSC